MTKPSSADPFDQVPMFGARTPGAPYVVRPSAYALVEDERGMLAVARTPEGLFLPGGGVEMGETVEQTIVREALEECGLVIRAGALVARAVQLVHSRPEARRFEKHSAFLIGTIEEVRARGTEADHELCWLAPEDAARELKLESDRWAVMRWRELVEHAEQRNDDRRRSNDQPCSDTQPRNDNQLRHDERV